MQLGDITPLIIEYKYWILLPLSFAEGPIVAFIAGTLSAAGYFNIYLLGIFFLVRDLVVDLGCYYLGHFGGKWPWVQRLLARMGVTQDHLDDVSALWNKHPAKTMFFSKLSYGVAAGFIVVAGMVNMRLRSFLLYGLLITLMHYGVLLVVGYFFGQSFGGQITTIIERVPYIIGAASLFLIAYYFFKRYSKRKLEEQIEKMKQLDQEVYDKVIDKVASKYQAVKNIDKAEVVALATDLKKHWKNISKSLKTAKPKGKK